MTTNLALFAAIAIMAQPAPRQGIDRAGAPEKATLSKPEADRLNRISARLERLSRRVFLDADDQAEYGKLIDEGFRDFGADPTILYWMGDRFERMNQPDKAIEQWERALEAKPKGDDQNRAPWARCAERIGHISLARRQVERGEAMALKAIEYAPRRPEGYALLMDASLLNGKIDETTRLVAAAARNPATSTPAIVDLALEALAQSGAWQELKRMLEEQAASNASAPSAHHFLARIADADGKPSRAFAHHYLAVQLGESENRAASRSAAIIDRWVQRGERYLRSPLKDWVLAYTDAERASDANKALAYLDAIAPNGDVERLAHLDLRGITLATLDRQDEAAACWNELLKTSPSYAPACVSLAEYHEARGDGAGADEWFERAKKLVPGCRRVLLIDRLGGRFELDPTGVAVRRIIPDRKLAGAGLLAGDVIVSIDGALLEEQSPIDRIRSLRQYGGGRLTFTRNGKERVVEIPIFYGMEE